MSDSDKNTGSDASRDDLEKNTDSKGQDHHDNGTHNRNRGKRNKRNTQPRNNQFKGQCTELEYVTYDMTANLTNQDLYTTMTQKLGDYITRTYDRAGEFRLGMMNLKLPTIDLPTSPSAKATTAEIEIYKIDLQEAKSCIRSREENSQRIFPLVLGQCSRTIWDRMEAHQNWQQVNEDSDVMGLLTLIRRSMHNKATTKQITHSYAEAEADLIRFRQTDKMSNSDYLEKFKGLISVYEHCGGEPRVTSTRIKLFQDPSEPDTDKAEREARAKAKNEYIAISFLLKSDPK